MFDAKQAREITNAAKAEIDAKYKAVVDAVIEEIHNDIRGECAKGNGSLYIEYRRYVKNDELCFDELILRINRELVSQGFIVATDNTDIRDNAFISW